MHRRSRLIVCHTVGAFTISSYRLTSAAVKSRRRFVQKHSPRLGIVIFQQVTGSCALTRGTVQYSCSMPHTARGGFVSRSKRTAKQRRAKDRNHDIPRAARVTSFLFDSPWPILVANARHLQDVVVCSESQCTWAAATSGHRLHRILAVQEITGCHCWRSPKRWLSSELPRAYGDDGFGWAHTCGVWEGSGKKGHPTSASE